MTIPLIQMFYKLKDGLIYEFMKIKALNEISLLKH